MHTFPHMDQLNRKDQYIQNAICAKSLFYLEFPEQFRPKISDEDEHAPIKLMFPLIMLGNHHVFNLVISSYYSIAHIALFF